MYGCTRISGGPVSLYNIVVYSQHPKLTRALHDSLPRPPRATATAVDGAAADATPGGGAEAVSLSNSTDLTSS